jgi:hypothetical protein
MKARFLAFAIGLATTLTVGAAAAQEPVTSVPPARNLPSTVNVFLDCSYYCDFDFIRTEVSYVNWVRDRTDADVHVLVTSQGTGGGGSEYTLAFIGLRGFAATSDTLKYVSTVNATSDDIRKGLTRTITLGLVRFVARTTTADRLLITLAPLAAGETKTAPTHDPWHAWVFSVSGQGYMNGEHTYRSMFGYTSFDANRVTEAFKSNLNMSVNYDESKVFVDDVDSLGNPLGTTTTYTTIQRDWGVSTGQVKSLTDRWSAAFNASLGSQTYVNQRHSARATVAAEYNLFPYKEATRRQLRLQYGVGAAYYHYIDTTIFLKIKETVPIHYLSAAYSTKQPWGSTNASITHNALLRDPAKRSTRISGNTNIRVFKGLSVSFGGGYSWIHDQLYLRKEATDQAGVLLRQHQLLTAYRYNANVGLSYTFGSIFNNIVNPRFGGTGGDFFFF